MPALSVRRQIPLVGLLALPILLTKLYLLGSLISPARPFDLAVPILLGDLPTLGAIACALVAAWFASPALDADPSGKMKGALVYATRFLVVGMVFDCNVSGTGAATFPRINRRLVRFVRTFSIHSKSAL